MEHFSLLFAYGTLRRGSNTSAALPLIAKLQWVGTATLRGRLYDMGGYPGLIPAADGDIIEGDLYDLSDNALLQRIDDYEECSGAFPQPHEYRRERVRVTTSSGEVEAWTYIYAWPIEEAPRLTHWR